MYKGLTRYLPEFDKVEGYGDWIIDRASRGTMDNPIQIPYVDYDPLAMASMMPYTPSRKTTRSMGSTGTATYSSTTD